MRIDGFARPVGRGAFVAWGLALFVLKCVLDWQVSSAFGETWTPLIYFSPRVSPLFHPNESPRYWLALLAVALPFLVAGVRLCAGRLADMGVRPLWCGLFLAPFVHWAFFLVLAFAPPGRRESAPAEATGPPDGSPADAQARVLLAHEPPVIPGLAALVPEGTGGRYLLAVGGSLVLSALGLALLAVAPRDQTQVPFFLHGEVLGAGLFFGLPFGLGFWSAFVVSYRRDASSAPAALGAGLLSLAGGLLILLAVAYEGIACIIMAAPILGVTTILGAVVGHLAAKLPGPQRSAAAAAILVLFLLGRDVVRPPEPVTLVETTEVQIAAAPEVVWKHVTAVSPMEAEPAAIFAICAMPLESRLEGTGVGAKRRCVLTVGDLEETVEVWDEARELTFRVDRAPERFARYGAVERGQFLLSRNADGSTTVRGTTWYRMAVAPAGYWSLWTQAFVEAVHVRVLGHVKRLAEHPETSAPARPAPQPAWMSAVNATCNCTKHAPEH